VAVTACPDELAWSVIGHLSDHHEQ